MNMMSYKSPSVSPLLLVLLVLKNKYNIIIFLHNYFYLLFIIECISLNDLELYSILMKIEI